MTALQTASLWMLVASLVASGCKKQDSQQGFLSVSVNGEQKAFVFPHIINKKTPPYQYTFWVRQETTLLSVHLQSDKPIAPGLYTTNDGSESQFAEISYAMPDANTFTHFNNLSYPHPLQVRLISVTESWIEGTLTARLEKENLAGPGPVQLELTEGRFRMPAQNP